MVSLVAAIGGKRFLTSRILLIPMWARSLRIIEQEIGAIRRIARSERIIEEEIGSVRHIFRRFGVKSCVL